MSNTRFYTSMCFLNAVQASLTPHPLCHVFDRLDAGPVQVIVVLARLDELVLLDVLLHLFSGHHKVVVSPVHLVVPLWPGGIFNENTRGAFFFFLPSDERRQIRFRCVGDDAEHSNARHGITECHIYEPWL